MVRIAAAAALAVVACLSACGSSGQSTTPTPAPTTTATSSGTGAVIHYSLNASGTTTLSQQLPPMAAGVAGAPLTCAQFVNVGRFYQLLQGDSSGPAWGLNIDIQPYSGPGTYMTTTAQLEWDLSGGTYHPPVDANGVQRGFKLTSRADGSGAFIITAWPDVNNPAKTESGVLTWTCTNS